MYTNETQALASTGRMPSQEKPVAKGFVVIRKAKKQRALKQLNMEDVFRFTDLPAEIRNEIYWLALKTRGDIVISRHRVIEKINSNDSPTLKSVKRSVRYKIKGTTILLYGRRKRRVAVAAAHPLNILRVSKLIRSEAMPVFYGSNRFIFDTSTAMSKFKLQTGIQFGLLKDVVVKSLTYANQNYLYNSLPALKNPTRVEITGMMCKWTYDDPTKVSGWVWCAVKNFVTNRPEWASDDLYAKGPHKYVPIDDDEQKQRFDALRFVLYPGSKITGEGGTRVQIKNIEHGHEVFREAMLKRLEANMISVK